MQHERRTDGNSAETNIVHDSPGCIAYAPASTQPLHPRHQTKGRIKAIRDPRPDSARQIISESAVHTRPAPPVRRFSFRKVACQQSPIYLNESAVTQSDSHLDRRLNHRSPVQNQPPKKMLAPRSRPSVFGAFSSLPPNLVPSPLVANSDPGYRNDEDIPALRVSGATWCSTVSSLACIGAISSCISDHSQAMDSVLSVPLYAWTPTPEPRASSIMGNHTYSSSSPCLTTSTTAPTAAAAASTTSLLPRTKKPGQRYSFKWLSKKQSLDSSALAPLTTSSFGVPAKVVEPRCMCTEQGRCRFHKDLPGLSSAGEEDTVLENKNRFSRLRHRNHDEGRKPKSDRLSVLSTSSLRKLVRGSNEEKGKSASASWASKLKLKKDYKSDLTATVSTITSDAAMTTRHRNSLVGVIRERRAIPFRIVPKSSTMSAPIVVHELQKQPRRLIPNFVQRALDRRAGHTDRSRSSSMMFEWDGHSNVCSSPSTSHSTIATPAASAMPTLGIPHYNPVMSASSPCLSMATKAPCPVQDVCHTSAVASVPRRHRPTIVTDPIPTIPTPVPLRDQGHQFMNDESGPSRSAKDLVPKQTAASYEKEKFSFFEPFRMKNRNPSYISFHFDISHLEDQRLEQEIPLASECQDENQRSENQHLDTLEDQTSTRFSEHRDQDMSGQPKGPAVEGAQDSPVSSHSVLRMFRRPAFLSSMPSFPLPSLLLPEFSSSMLNLGRATNLSPLATSSTTLPLSNPAPANRDPLGSSENHAPNLSRRRLHHFCYEGLEQPTENNLEDGAS